MSTKGLKLTIIYFHIPKSGKYWEMCSEQETPLVCGLVDAEQLRCQVQLVEEGQRKHGKK